MTSAKDQGAAAGEMLSRILSGEKADSIPVRLETPSRIAFDYRQLVRFGIAKSRLPDHSIISHEPWHETYRWLIWLAAFTVVAFLSLAAALWSSIAKRRQADQELRIAAKAFDIQVGMVVTDHNGTILRVNDAFTRTTGLFRRRSRRKEPFDAQVRPTRPIVLPKPVASTRHTPFLARGRMEPSQEWQRICGMADHQRGLVSQRRGDPVCRIILGYHAQSGCRSRGSPARVLRSADRISESRPSPRPPESSDCLVTHIGLARRFLHHQPQRLQHDQLHARIRDRGPAADRGRHENPSLAEGIRYSRPARWRRIRGRH